MDPKSSSPAWTLCSPYPFACLVNQRAGEVGGGADDAPGGGGGGQLHARPRRHVRPLGARIAQRCSSLSLPINRIKIPYSQEVTQTTPLLSDLHISGEVPPGSGMVRRYLVVVIPRGTHVLVQLEGSYVSRCCCSCACVVQCSSVLVDVDRGLVLGPLAAWCSSASRVAAADVPLGINIGSSISVNLPLVQART